MKRGKYSLLENKGFFFKHKVDIKKIITDAEKGNPEAQQSLAACYLYGLHDFEINQAKGFQLALESAQKGLPEGIGLLGICYLYGLGTKADENKAFECFEKAAKLGCDFAIYNLGVCYVEGTGVEQNAERGLEILQKSADDNFEDSINYLADIYQKHDVPEEAFKLLKKGNNLGNLQSQTRLGLCYLLGEGTTKDVQKGFGLIQEAAENHLFGFALYLMGMIYEEGVEGLVEPDPDIAKIYYKKAVENGYEPDAQKESGHILLEDFYNEFSKIDISQETAINYNNEREKIQSCIVYIQHKEGDVIHQGSGFVISPEGHVATCAHVVRGSNEFFIKVIDENNKTVIKRGTLVKADDETDTGIIKIENAINMPHIGLDFDRDAAELGEDVVIYGYPLGVELNDHVLDLNISFAKGYVSSNQVYKGIKRTMLDISAKHGNSGSPLISCKTGKVIGILSGGQNDHYEECPTDEINYMMPICYLKDLIKEVNSGISSSPFEAESSGESTESKKDDNKVDFKSPEKWAEVKRILRKEYKVADENNDRLRFVFDLENNRSQSVFAELAQNEDSEQWVKISSCVGLIDNSEINEVLKRLGECCFGGLVLEYDKHYIRHSLLLDSVSEPNLLRSIVEIAQLADEIEEKYTGGDQY